MCLFASTSCSPQCVRRVRATSPQDCCSVLMQLAPLPADWLNDQGSRVCSYESGSIVGQRQVWHRTAGDIASCTHCLGGSSHVDYLVHPACHFCCSCHFLMSCSPASYWVCLRPLCCLLTADRPVVNLYCWTYAVQPPCAIKMDSPGV